MLVQTILDSKFKKQVQNSEKVLYTLRPSMYRNKNLRNSSKYESHVIPLYSKYSREYSFTSNLQSIKKIRPNMTSKYNTFSFNKPQQTKPKT